MKTNLSVKLREKGKVICEYILLRMQNIWLKMQCIWLKIQNIWLKMRVEYLELKNR